MYQAKEVEVACFLFVFQTLIRQLTFIFFCFSVWIIFGLEELLMTWNTNRLSEFFKRQYIEYFLWIFHTVQVTCKVQEVDNKLNWCVSIRHLSYKYCRCIISQTWVSHFLSAICCWSRLSGRFHKLSEQTTYGSFGCTVNCISHGKTESKLNLL